MDITVPEPVEDGCTVEVDGLPAVIQRTGPDWMDNRGAKWWASGVFDAPSTVSLTYDGAAEQFVTAAGYIYPSFVLTGTACAEIPE